MKPVSTYLAPLLLLLLANGVTAEPFKLTIEVFAIAIEGQMINYIYKQITGSPTCIATVTDESSTQLYQSTSVVNTPLVTETVNSDQIGSITENFIANFNFVCSSDSNSITFDLKTLVYAQETIGATTLPYIFFQAIDISDTQTSPFVLSLRSSSGASSCTVESDDTSKATLDKTGPFVVRGSRVNIQATQVGSSASGIMKITCNGGSPALTTVVNMPIYFSPTSNPWASASGDPHFQQLVLNKLSSTIKRICYDVTGSPDDYIYIAGYSETDLQIFGQLKDDYYMHRILIKSPFGNITAAANHVTLDNKNVLAWNENHFESEMFKYQIFTKHILISTLKGSPLTIKIQKSINSLSEVHLDVSLKLLPADYEKMTGLLGDVGRKEYQFFSDVQSRDGNEPVISTIGVGKNLIRGTRIERSNAQCWLMNIDDLLMPLKMSNYIYKEINGNFN